MTQATTQISSSIDSLTKELEIITHNLANASTVGFKRRCNAFSKALDAQQGGRGDIFARRDRFEIGV